MKFQIYKDAAGEWRWRAKAKNGEIMADSAEGYTRKADLKIALALFINDTRNHAEVEESTD